MHTEANQEPNASGSQTTRNGNEHMGDDAGIIEELDFAIEPSEVTDIGTESPCPKCAETITADTPVLIHPSMMVAEVLGLETELTFCHTCWDDISTQIDEKRTVDD